MRIDVDGKQYQVIHFRFAINNPRAKITKSDNVYLADFNGLVYALGSTARDGTPKHIANEIERAIKLRRKNER
tara:strand:+ start:165 stop:383 length:219 start_codon:yes stop_codon:yes gene_type:complete